MRFQLPDKVPQLLDRLPVTQLVDLTVLSALPTRELQQCAERVPIPPLFCEKLDDHIYKNSLALRGPLRNKPYTAVSVRITYDSSTTVLLCGLPQSVVRGCAALGLAVPRSSDLDGAPVSPPSAGSDVILPAD
ncbi:hypothetical protein NXY56_007092 [Leishmania guyanensis]